MSAKSGLIDPHRALVAGSWLASVCLGGLLLHFGGTLPFPFLSGFSGAAVLTLMLCAGHYVPPRYQPSWLFGVILLGFWLPLVELWCSGASPGLVIGGLLPNTDAHAYWTESSRVTEGGVFSEWGCRRPLAGSYLASIIWLTGGDIRWTVSLLAAFTAVGVSAFCWEIRRQIGWLAAALAAALFLLYYRRFIGSTMSESGGLTFGALAGALLLRGFRERHTGTTVLGVLVLSLGLNIRAGPFILLVTIPLAFGFIKRQTPRAALVAMLFTVVAGAAGFLAVFGALKFLGTKGAAPFGNHAVVAYGVIFGGDWTKAQVDHPELTALPERERAKRLYAIIGEAIEAEPTLLFKGAWRAVSAFSPSGGYPPFLFVGHGRLGQWLFFGWVAGGLASLGLFWHRPVAALSLAGTLGMLCSLPFAPPWDADGMRAYAAGIPFLIITLCYSAEALRLAWNCWFRRTDAGTQTMAASPRRVLVSLTVMAVSLVVLVPLLARFALPRSPRVTIKEYTRDTEAHVRLSAGSLLRFRANGRSGPDALLVADFASRLAGYDSFWPKEARFLADHAAPGVVFAAGGSSLVTVMVLKDRPNLVDQSLAIRGRIELMPDGYFFVEEGL